VTRLRKQEIQAIKSAVNAGVMQAEVADVCELTRSRINQIVKNRTSRRR
jgi:predicted XRE-type DNA-binding protein